ncbi:MAG: PAS domain S-box protein [Desulfobacteraceae bacterium]|nr:PAS domain S-box protein [Desulfobacteraceae bacterium]MCB9494235.1 PAS domain S-box protein [Desulfobacteraceae bacterium]
MKQKFFSKMIERSPFGFAILKTVKGENGDAEDFEFIEANPSFLSLAGINSKSAEGHTLKNLIPETSGFNWIEFYKEIVSKGQEGIFEQYFESLKRWYKVHCYLFEKGYVSTVFIDITSDKQNSDELENFFSVNLDLLCIADTEGNFLKLNRQWENTLGYSRDELYKRKFLDFIHPCDIEPTIDAISKLSSQKKVTNFINRYRAKDGSYRFIEWRSYPKGSLIYAAARDVTQQILGQQSLRESELNFRNFFETIDDMIFIGKKDGKILYTNPSARDKLGYTDEELKKMSVFDIYPDKAKGKAGKILSGMNQDKKRICSLPFECKNKKEIPVETRIWFGKWNGEDSVFAISKDLSRQQDVLQKFNGLFEGNPALMAVTTIPEKKFSEVNASFLKTLGYSKKDIIGKTVKELNIFDDYYRLKEISRLINDKGSVNNIEVRIRTKFNKILTGLFSGKIIRTPAKDYVVNVMTDISAQKEAENKLIYYSKMQNILMKIATKYINISIDEAECSINKALSDIGTHFNADRVYIFDYDFKNHTTSNLFEWCNSGIEPQIEKLQNIPFEVVEYHLELHSKGIPMLVKDVSKLPSGKLKDVLVSQNIKTLLTVPMKNRDNLTGFIGFDWVREHHECTEIEIDILFLFAEVLVNINLRIEAEILLAKNRERLDLALEGANVGLWDWYVQTGEAVFDNRWAEMAGYELAELEPVSIKTWIDLCHPEDFLVSSIALNEHFSGKTDFYEAELRMKHKNGEWIWVLERGRVVDRDIQGNPLRITGTHIDITARKKTEEMIRHLANHDALTGLPTLRLAKDRACIANKRAFRYEKMTAYMFVDLDGFKLVNDTFGHEAGDALLKEIASRLMSAIRKSDTAARIGGDEFLIIITEIDSLEPVVDISKKLIKKVSEPFLFNDNPLNVGCSIGISIYPKNGNDIEYLIKQADAAMYSIKKNGKNNFAFAADNE